MQKNFSHSFPIYTEEKRFMSFGITLVSSLILLKGDKMANIPKKVFERISSKLKEIQKKSKKATELDISEAQTVSSVIKPFLTDLLGYDEFEDLTDQYCVRGTFCDICIKANEKPYIMVEAKAANVTLKDIHIKQAKDYGLNSGVQWIILTNGSEWQIYKIIFKQPVTEELVMSFNINELNHKKSEDITKLFYLCKEAIAKSEINNLYAEKIATNKYIIANLLFKDENINFIKKELKKLFPEVAIQPELIISILKNKIIRRDLQEAPEAQEARKQIDRSEKKLAKAKEKAKNLAII